MGWSISRAALRTESVSTRVGTRLTGTRVDPSELVSVAQGGAPGEKAPPSEHGARPRAARRSTAVGGQRRTPHQGLRGVRAGVRGTTGVYWPQPLLPSARDWAASC